MIVSDYTCDRCQAEMRYRILPRFYSLVDDTKVSIRDWHAWCLDCHALRPAEVLPTIESLEQRIEALRQNRLDERDHEVMQLLEKTEAKYIAGELADAVAALAWRRERCSPPRCLECGSTNFVPIPMVFDEEGMEYCIHPDCGGKLVYIGGPFVSVKSHPLYDGEGKRLTE